MSTDIEEIKRIVFAFCEYSDRPYHHSFSSPPALTDRWKMWSEKFLTTENKLESSKKGEEKNSDRYIPQTEVPPGHTESSLRAKLREANNELQSLRDQLAAKEKELARYIAANSILCDSESEVKLANENNRLEIENRKLREALKELVPIAEHAIKKDRAIPFTYKVSYVRAKELLNHNP